MKLPTKIRKLVRDLIVKHMFDGDEMNMSDHDAVCVDNIMEELGGSPYDYELPPQLAFVDEKGELGTAMRRDSFDKGLYWRDAGEWGVVVGNTNKGEWTVLETLYQHTDHLIGKKLVPCSHEYWAESIRHPESGAVCPVQGQLRRLVKSETSTVTVK